MTTATANTQQTGQFEARQEVNLWKPNSEKRGAAALISFSNKHNCFWLKMMPQSGENSFDNTKAINIKLGVTDIGSLLVVLTGRSEGIGRKNEKGYWSGIFHENSKGSSTVDLSVGQYGLSLSASQKTGDEQAVRYRVGVTPSEAMCLEVLFKAKLPEMLFSRERE